MHRYLFTGDGSRFRLPARETVARILAYGRSSPEARPTLVFGTRSPANEIWADPELQARHRYDAVYAESTGRGIRVEL